ncbi:transposase [Halorhabdus amylolytica]|uniref:transposase n=1 Tax=Halorhabdus amylolytica TaxID=2559573 RepID=UPI00145A2F53|nr:transposase [Halorhabdus amylolytica]
MWGVAVEGTDIPVDQRDEDADWNDDHTEDDYYYDYGCCVVTAAHDIPVAAAFTPAKKVDEETAMCVTRDALGVDTPRWFLGDSEFDMLPKTLHPQFQQQEGKPLMTQSWSACGE